MHFFQCPLHVFLLTESHRMRALNEGEHILVSRGYPSTLLIPRVATIGAGVDASTGRNSGELHTIRGGGD